MVQRMNMSSRLFTVFLMLALALAAFAAHADSPAGEMVYRASLGSADDIKVLLKQGASANQTNELGVPVLCLAAARSDNDAIPVAKTLLAGGADINGLDKEGETALFYAARSGNLAMVNFLLNHGIKYYAEDKNDSIARTVAFENGHTDIVKAMDDFVNAQTKKVEEDYQKAYALMARRKEAQEGAAPSPASPPDKETQARRQQNVEQLEKGLSYHACQFQYWYFVDAVKQDTELSADELNIAIDTHKKQVEAIEKTLIDTYGKETGFVSDITDSAKKRVYNQLAAMETNFSRHEQGIGRMDDAEARCQHVARDWDIPASSVPQVKPDEGGVATGGIGGVGAGMTGGYGTMGNIPGKPGGLITRPAPQQKPLRVPARPLQ